eukprot:CAMPEP_0185478024 /NCGR_PEP_ID=MMETSP1366-20130426/4465_1 /TAXON_ID=38817 /ORGANISM="Gephyrocapsa oceanica, Strain RCC1303" /LENGTH=197 /DNA_ID=CAMNT_0028085249 /DNA_START=61 /DNA_END=651 /DNA_ORIENTATION=+
MRGLANPQPVSAQRRGAEGGDASTRTAARRHPPMAAVSRRAAVAEVWPTRLLPAAHPLLSPPLWPKLITVPKLSFAPREEGAIAGAAGVEDRADPAHTQQNHGQSPQRQEQEECGGEAAHRRETAEVAENVALDVAKGRAAREQLVCPRRARLRAQLHDGTQRVQAQWAPNASWGWRLSLGPLYLQGDWAQATTMEG